MPIIYFIYIVSIISHYFLVNQIIKLLRSSKLYFLLVSQLSYTIYNIYFKIQYLNIFSLIIKMFLIDLHFAQISQPIMTQHSQLQKIREWKQKKKRNHIILQLEQIQKIVGSIQDGEQIINLIQCLYWNKNQNTLSLKIVGVEENNYLIRFQSRYLRIILLRKYLYKNNQRSSIKNIFHPITGQFSISIFTHFFYYDNMNYSFYQILKNFCSDILSSLLPQILNDFHLLINQYYSPKQQQQLAQKYILANNQYDLQMQISRANFNQQLKNTLIKNAAPIDLHSPHSIFGELFQIKRYIMQSSYYAWSILSCKTSTANSSCFRQDTLRETKAQIRSIGNINKKSVKMSDLTKVNGSYNLNAYVVNNLYINTQEQDVSLKSVYFSYIEGISSISLQINNISMSRQFLRQVITHKQIKINSGTTLLYLTIVKFQSYMIQSMRHQRQILKCLPRNQFPGIARYYFIKNLEAQTQLYRFTNLSNSITLDKYFASNSQIISLQSKINILTQIAMTLRYIRNASIVYLSLTPASIYLRRGQHAKLFNFKNSYNPNVPGCENNLRCFFPFVFVDKDHLDQKIDVFSFGALLYWCIYNTTPLNIKQSTLRKINSNIFLLYLMQNKVLGLQKNKIHKLKIFDLLFYFALLCYQLAIPISNLFPSEIRFLNQKSNLNYKKLLKKNGVQIPFQDWIVITIKYIQSFIVKACYL